jgi:hypothetical protein
MLATLFANNVACRALQNGSYILTQLAGVAGGGDERKENIA